METLKRLSQPQDENLNLFSSLPNGCCRCEVGQVRVRIRVAPVVENLTSIYLSTLTIRRGSDHSDSGDTPREEVATKKGWTETLRLEDYVIKGYQGASYRDLVVLGL
jgi:hypothetical protein